MKKTIALMTLLSTMNVFAYNTDKTDIAVTYKQLSDTEAQAVELGVSVEAKIKAGKFKTYQSNQCDSISSVKFETKSVEIKKLYINGVAKYVTTVNAVMDCELEYQM